MQATGRRRTRGAAHLTVATIACIAFVATSAWAATSARAAPKAFNLSAQDVTTGTARFGRQADVQILIPGDIARNRRINAVHGRYEIAQALAVMLQGTGLEARQVSDGVYVLVAVAAKSQLTGPPPSTVRSPPPVPPAPVEVIVTGTRIRKPNATSASPVISLDQQELTFGGMFNLEDALNRLPQVRADSTQFQNGSDIDGRAKVNLRNLGWQRTLVLLDGQRLLPVQAIDLNIIPSALVRRVDVLTGGASSTYGSDAVAGVINFVLDKHFDGVQISGSYGAFEHVNDASDIRTALAQYPNIKVPGKTAWDGRRRDINIAAGKTFAGGRGTISAFADYRKQDPVLWSARDYSACRLADNGTGLGCAVNKFYSEYGTFIPNDGASAGSTLHLARDGSQTFVSGDDAYAFNTREKFAFLRSDERFTGGLFANYRFNDQAEVYASYLYMKDTTSSLFYPALVDDTAFINCNNPYMSASQATTLCGASAGTSATVSTRVAYQLNGPGSAALTNQAVNSDYRFSAGIRGDVLDVWHYDVNLVTSQVYTSLSDNNEIDDAKFIAALNAVTVGGKVVCASHATDPSCVPANIFSYHSVDPAFYAWAYRDYKWHSVTSQQDVTANITGDLTRYGVRSPWANDGVAIALGAEYRRDALRNDTDQATLDYEGWLSTVGGHYGVVEVYGEVQIPLVTDKPFVNSLVFNAGYRISKYDNIDKGLPTSKYELLYRPVKALLLRASFNNAARAPNVSELFGAKYFSVNGSLVDRCAGATPAATAAQCAYTGVSASQYGTVTDCDTQCRTYAGGGNPLLRPEAARTLTYGLVYTPKAVPSLLISVDYYDILINHYIGYLDAVDNFTKCLNTGLDFYCQYIHRSATTGALNGTGYVEGGTLNTYRLHNRGLDLQASYSFAVGRWGRIDTNFMGTALAITGGQGTPDQPVTDCAGFFGDPNCYTPEPKWRHNLRATWRTPWHDANLSLNWRHIGHTMFSGNSSDPAVSNNGCCVSTVITRLPDYDYIDLAAAMKLRDNLTLNLSINNLVDLTPPILPSTHVDGTTNNPNTYTGTYDPLGRAILLKFTYKM